MAIFVEGPYRTADPRDNRLHFEQARHHQVFLNSLQQCPTVARLEQLLLQYPDVDLSAGGRLGQTALTIAIHNKSLQLMRRILELRPDLANKTVTAHKRDLLPLCAVVNDRDIAFSLAAVDELLAKDADINRATQTGITPLLVSALKADHMAVTQALLSRGGVIYKGVPINLRSTALQNIFAALTLEGVSAFVKETLHNTKRSRHSIDQLPLDLRCRIASFIVPEEFVDANALSVI